LDNQIISSLLLDVKDEDNSNADPVDLSAAQPDEEESRWQKLYAACSGLVTATAAIAR
jgi:hypothetical protein